jgi:hypothetical protein
MRQLAVLRNTHKTLWIVVLAACFLSALLAAEEPRTQEPKTPFARVDVQSARVDWLPHVDYEHLVLTIAGPGAFYLQREFPAGETPSFSALNVPAGVYAYELRGDLAEGPAVQWGHLWVQGGSFITEAPAQPSPPKRSAASPPIQTITENLIDGDHACFGDDCVDASGPPLKIKESGNYQIIFDGLNCCAPSERRWALHANENFFSGDFVIRDLSQGTIPFRIGSSVPDNAFTILFNGNIGLGTLTPARALHIIDTGATDNTVLEVQNNAAARIRINNSANGEVWNLGHQVSSGTGFVLSDVGDAVSEMLLDTAGNVTFAGTVTPMSSRTMKEQFGSVDPHEVLRRVVDLPIATWSYKATPDVRHVGPMSEDFFAAFAVGADDKGISVTDSSGVALAAIQGLYQELAARDAEIATLRARIEELAARLETAPQ